MKSNKKFNILNILNNEKVHLSISDNDGDYLMFIQNPESKVFMGVVEIKDSYVTLDYLLEEEDELVPFHRHKSHFKQLKTCYIVSDHVGMTDKIKRDLENSKDYEEDGGMSVVKNFNVLGYGFKEVNQKEAMEGVFQILLQFVDNEFYKSGLRVSNDFKKDLHILIEKEIEKY